MQGLFENKYKTTGRHTQQLQESLLNLQVHVSPQRLHGAIIVTTSDITRYTLLVIIATTGVLTATNLVSLRATHPT